MNAIVVRAQPQCKRAAVPRGGFGAVLIKMLAELGGLLSPQCNFVVYSAWTHRVVVVVAPRQLRSLCPPRA